MFESLLYIPDLTAEYGIQVDGDTAFRVIVEKGDRADQITTTWFRDGALGLCTGPSSLAALANAGGDLATGTCRMKFKVLSGAILGAAANSNTPCSAGTYAVKHPAGIKSCIACQPGSASIDGKSCSQCTDQSYADNWGASKCMPCEEPAYGNTYCLVVVSEAGASTACSMSCR
jgi:hypothetical protein